jgi:hypothetical protein
MPRLRAIQPATRVVGATGFEPVICSVSGTAGRWRRPALSGRMWPVSWEEAGPLVTAVVRCDPVVCGPDVARVWPRPSRAWKARSVPSSWPDATPTPQVRTSWDRPLLPVSDRQMPVLRACGGHSRRGRTWLGPGSDGHKLNRTVRFVRDGHLPRGKSPEVARQENADHLERWCRRRLTPAYYSLSVAGETTRHPGLDSSTDLLRTPVMHVRCADHVHATNGAALRRPVLAATLPRRARHWLPPAARRTGLGVAARWCACHSQRAHHSELRWPRPPPMEARWMAPPAAPYAATTAPPRTTPRRSRRTLRCR